MRPPMEQRCRMRGPARVPLWVLSVLLSLRAPPARSQLVFSVQPQHAVGLPGAPLALDCAVYDLGQQRALSVRWEKSGSGETRGLPHTGSESAGVFQLVNGSLFFPLLRESDLGNYVCSGAAGPDRISATVQVDQAGLAAVFFSPRNQTVSEGEAVFLQCVSGESSPAALVSWMKDGELVKRGKQIQGQYGGGNQRKTSSTLHLPNVTRDDGGVYECVTHNPLLGARQRSAPATLTVLGAPTGLQITQGPASITVAMGTEAVMRCPVHVRPVPMVHWFKGNRLLTNRTASLGWRDNGQLLIFRNVSEEDVGSYHCEASTQQEAVRSPSALLRLAVMGWRFVRQPSNRTARRGENVTLVCRPPSSVPTAWVSWVKEDGALAPEALLAASPAGDLLLHRVQEADAGTYFCRASNHLLNRSVSSRRVALTVLAPPTVRLRPLLVTVAPGGAVRLHCEVGGLPRPSIRWYKRGPSTQTGGRIAVGQRNASLYFLSVRNYDEGAYTCEATNVLGQDRGTAKMRVQVMPVIVGFSGQVSSRLGAPVELPCRAVGVLPITYTWTRGNETGTRASITITTSTTTDPTGNLDGGALQISAVRSSDAGHYYCRAENQAGRDQIHTILAVTGESRGGDYAVQMWNMGTDRTQASEELPAIRLLQNHSGMNHSDPATHTELLAHRPPAALPPLKDTLYGRPRPLGSPNYQPLLARLDPQRAKPTSQPALPTPNGQILQPPSTQPDPQPADHTSPPPHIGLLVSSPYPEPHATRSPEPGPRDPGILAAAAGPALPRPSVDRSAKNSPAGTLQLVDRETVMGQSQDWEETHIRADPPAAPEGIGAILPSLPKALGSTTRSPDSTETPVPRSTRRDDPTTPANQRGPAAVPLSLALTATSLVGAGPQLQHPPTQGSPVEPRLAEDPRMGPEDLTMASLVENPGLEAMQNPSAPQFTQSSSSTDELPLKSLHDEAEPTPSLQPPPPSSSSPPPGGLSSTGPVASSHPKPRLPLSQLHGPFHAPPSVFSTTTTTTTPTPTAISSTSTPTTTTTQTTTTTTPTSTTTQAPTGSTTPNTTATAIPSTPTPVTTTTTQTPITRTTTTTPTNVPTLITTPTTISTTTQTPMTRTNTTTTPTPTNVPTTPTPTNVPTPTTINTTTPTTINTTTPNTISTTTATTITTSTPTTNSTPITITSNHKQTTVTSTTTTHNTPNVITSRTTAPTSTITTISALTSASRPSGPGGQRLTTQAAPDGGRSNVSQATDPSQTSGSTSDPRPTVGLKTNISQSPMTSDDPRVTPKTPSWLPGLEKHDIPIVVGVGVSLAFIFITMAFYSLFQSNEPVPINRAGLGTVTVTDVHQGGNTQRNAGVPIRHVERQLPGKTYDNRAFEDDECVAVIEQSPNTSDTRARPLGAGLVLVQMEAPPEDLRENHQLSLMEDRPVSTETFPLGTLLDSQVGARVEEDKAFSLSPPSSRLHCVEDWVSSSSGSLRPACQEPPPPRRSPPTPPSSLPPPPFSLPPPLSSCASHSPSPTLSLCPSSPSPSSLATVREERLHSSLTLQAPAQPASASSHTSSTASTLPVHHSLSVSHAASSPLLVSHRVSLGSSTNVTVDVTFHPAGTAPTAAMAIATSTHISNTAPGAGPLFNFPLAHSHESDQSATSMPHGK